MKKIGTLALPGRSVSIDQGIYDNGRVAIALDGGRFGKLTVNIPHAPLEAGQIFVKTWGENEWLREAALATGLFTDTGGHMGSGFCIAEVWKFHP